MQHTAHHVPLRSGSLPHPRFAHPAKNVAAFGIEPGMKIADFGAGSGAYVLAIARMLEAIGTVYAVDIQKDLLRRIANEAKAEGLKNVEIVWGDLEKPHATKIADNTLNLVLISNVLFQVDDRKAPLLEAKRILKPGGRLVIIDWADSYNNMGPHKHSVLKKEEARSLAEEAGFEFVREFSSGTHHYGLIYKKP